MKAIILLFVVFAIVGLLVALALAVFATWLALQYPSTPPDRDPQGLITKELINAEICRQSGHHTAAAIHTQNARSLEQEILAKKKA